MADLSPGERAVLRLRWFIYDAGSRPVVVVAVLVTLAAAAAMAASVVGASAAPYDGVRLWIFVAANGFRPDVELGVLVAVVLLVIDALSSKPFPGQRAHLVLLVTLASAGLVANAGAAVSWLIPVSSPVFPGSTSLDTWTIVVSSHLGPMVLAGTAIWVAATGRRLGQGREGADG